MWWAEEFCTPRPCSRVATEKSWHACGRPPGVVGLDEDGNRHMRAGNVAASWRENRRRFALSLPDALPFVDVEHQDTWNTLEADIAMPASVHHLDVSHVRGADRLLTRAIAAWVYSQTDAEGAPLILRRALSVAHR